MNFFYPMRAWVALCVVSMLAACAGVGAAPQATFKERLAAGYRATVKVADAASALLKSGRITSVEARDIANKNDTAMLTLDRAKFLQTSDPAGANARLTEAATALTALQTDLEVKKASKS